MCLLTYFPPGISPDLSALSLGASANPHGHGFAVIAEGQIVVGHGMNAQEVLDEFGAVRARYPKREALFHSRYATHGDRIPANCHPFRLGSDARTVLAHNGVLPKRVHPGPFDPRSDTRIAAEDYLPRAPFGSIDTVRGARGLASWLGSSKLLILTVDPAYHYSAYLFGSDAGRWDGGIWYSNTSYLPRPRPPRRYLCDYCGLLNLDSSDRHCGQCGWCFECEYAFPDCACLESRTRTHPAPSGRRALAAAAPPRPILLPVDPSR
ncbi:hypothetical protein [Nocardia brasiliensis]|uniref:hypothetical protein n=1 Tax=Nocardia brasiliensis TaxID=37326 RepID=UPI000689E289|nr:hypothetical protein [Nocardia brasiliensis]